MLIYFWEADWYLYVLGKKYHLESCAPVVDNNMLQGREMKVQIDLHAV